MNDERLQIYLDDHLALLIGEIELAKRCQSENSGDVVAEFLQLLVADLERQRDALSRTLQNIGGSPSKLKQGMPYAGMTCG